MTPFDPASAMSAPPKVDAAVHLEAVGRLAAGIAHEINTPIQYVGDSVQYLRDAFEDLLALVAVLDDPSAGDEARRAARDRADLPFLRDEAPKAFERTVEGLERVATIVRAMRELSRGGDAERRPTDLEAALRNTLVVSRSEYKYFADVETDFCGLSPVPCCIAEINQVFLNLVVNAAHAVGDVVAARGGRGRIRLRTRLDAGAAVVEVEDTGGGIPPAIAARVFDPFFTTKPVGRGTGQGLAIARSIVERHRGTLAFSTEPGRGTTFVVRLPLRAA